MNGLTLRAIVRLQNAVATTRDDESGQTLVEYALIIALVSIGTIAALLAVTGKLNDTFNSIANQL